MQAPDPIETVMARLMPPAMSQQSQMDLEAMIDDLAGPEMSRGVSAARQTGRWLLGGGIAAALGALLAVFPTHKDVETPLAQASMATEGFSSGLVLLSESDRVESMTDEGWREDASGSALHAVRLNVIKENQLRDEESGMLVQISEPREETLLMPINSF